MNDEHTTAPTGAKRTGGARAWSKTPANPYGFSVTHRAAGFTGASVTKRVALGDPMVRKQFKKGFPASARSCYFILAYAHGLLAANPPVFTEHETDAIEKRAAALNLDATLVAHGAAGVLDLIHEAIAGAIAREAAEIAEHIAASEEVIRQAGMELPDYGEVEEYAVEITSPLAKRLIEPYRRADRLALLVNTLWIEDLLDEGERAQGMEVQVKRPVMRTFHTVRDLYLYLHRRWPYVVKDVQGRLIAELDPRKKPELSTPPAAVAAAAKKLEAGGEAKADKPKRAKKATKQSAKEPAKAEEGAGAEAAG